MAASPPLKTNPVLGTTQEMILQPTAINKKTTANNTNTTHSQKHMFQINKDATTAADNRDCPSHTQPVTSTTTPTWTVITLKTFNFHDSS